MVSFPTKNVRTGVRITLILIIIISSISFVWLNISSARESPFADFREQSKLPIEDREPLAPPSDGITVVTSHLKDAGDIVALHPNGTVLYHNGTHDGYWDIDPISQGEKNIVYSATDEVHNATLCNPVRVDDEAYCIRQMIERVNLTTGEVTTLYSRIDPRYHSSEWHDIDRINESYYLVADMYSDEAFIINVSSGIVTWEWNLQNNLSLSTGGQYPEDWAHLNDVEMLKDGRIMVSLRNQDQVVFLNRSTGVIKNWTLGADDNHRTLYEQHNPDYIPEKNGGPAVVIADSAKSRIVEYQRNQTGEWERTWVWKDKQLRWTRDADRLPNGHTLITDTHGGRVIEINKQGEIVWRLNVSTAYEAERLNTDEESTNGPSATKANLTSNNLVLGYTSEEDSSISEILITLKSQITEILPSKLVNGVDYLFPFWMGFYDITLFGVTVISIILWIGIEAKWSNYTFQIPITKRE